MCPREAERLLFIKGARKRRVSQRQAQQDGNWIKAKVLSFFFFATGSNCTLSLYSTYPAAGFQPISTYPKGKQVPQINSWTLDDFLARLHTIPQGALRKSPLTRTMVFQISPLTSHMHTPFSCFLLKEHSHSWLWQVWGQAAVPLPAGTASLAHSLFLHVDRFLLRVTKWRSRGMILGAFHHL